jgi:hypothetical protein
MGVSAERVKLALLDAGIKLRPAGRVAGANNNGIVSYEREFERMKPAIRARSRGRCEFGASTRCTGRGTHIHHRQLRAQGGPNTEENLVDICLFCHGHVHGNPTKSYAMGWLVRSGQDPKAIPWTRGEAA